LIDIVMRIQKYMLFIEYSKFMKVKHIEKDMMSSNIMFIIVTNITVL